jgi:tetratricopeptide (TPR) repeat protein
MIALAPNNAWAYLLREAVHVDIGAWGDALNDYNQVVALQSADAEVLTNRSHVKIQLGDIHGAHHDAEAALSYNPQNADAYVNRGWAKLLQEDAHGAVTDLSEALHYNPSLTAAYVLRAEAHIKARQLAAALDDLSQAISLGEENPKPISHEARPGFPSATSPRPYTTIRRPFASLLMIPLCMPIGAGQNFCWKMLRGRWMIWHAPSN